MTNKEIDKNRTWKHQQLPRSSCRPSGAQQHAIHGLRHCAAVHNLLCTTRTPSPPYTAARCPHSLWCQHAQLPSRCWNPSTDNNKCYKPCSHLQSNLLNWPNPSMSIHVVIKQPPAVYPLSFFTGGIVCLKRLHPQLLEYIFCATTYFPSTQTSECSSPNFSFYSFFIFLLNFRTVSTKPLENTPP